MTGRRWWCISRRLIWWRVREPGGMRRLVSFPGRRWSVWCATPVSSRPCTIPGGVTVGVGRTTRTVEPWLRRLVEGRDQGCRFPGCERTRWLHCHHIIAWSELGPTNLDNLVSLCGFHHRLIHRDGWTIAGDPNGPLQFYNKWGRPHSPVPDRFPSNWAATSDRFIDESAARRLAQLPNPAAPP